MRLAKFSVKLLSQRFVYCVYLIYDGSKKLQIIMRIEMYPVFICLQISSVEFGLGS